MNLSKCILMFAAWLSPKHLFFPMTKVFSCFEVIHQKSQNFPCDNNLIHKIIIMYPDIRENWWRSWQAKISSRGSFVAWKQSSETSIKQKTTTTLCCICQGPHLEDTMGHFENLYESSHSSQTMRQLKNSREKVQVFHCRVVNRNIRSYGRNLKMCVIILNPPGHFLLQPCKQT